MTDDTGWSHSPRGVSYNFGLGAVRDFMGRTGLRSIVRAHSMQAEGFEVLGSHEVITVFSAVNYRGSGEEPGHLTSQLSKESSGLLPGLRTVAGRTIGSGVWTARSRPMLNEWALVPQPLAARVAIASTSSAAWT